MTRKIAVKRFVVGPLSTNCYLVYDELSHVGILIDPGAYDSKIETYIKTNQINMVSIVNTHGHPDHIVGNSFYKLPVAIHRLDKPFLEPSDRERFLEDGDTIELGDIRLEVIHTPGHTPGGISLKVDDYLFTGDTLFCEGIGRTDLPGGDYDTLIKSIKERLLVLADSTKVFPGHGPETTIGHERRHNPFLG